MAYFDNAATTFPKPDCVYSYMNEYYRNSGANAGRGNYEMAQTASKLIMETRQLIQFLLHCENKQIVFTSSATLALNIIIQGLIKKGVRNIYISPFEHNAVTRVLHAFEKENQIRVFKLILTKEFQYDYERIKYSFEENKPDLVIVTHVSNVIGLVSPIADIFSLSKKFGAITLTDMSQSAGLVDCNLGLEMFDFAVFAGHKTLLGPTGISGFVMNKSIDLPPVLYGGTGYDSANQDMPNSLPEKYEFGTQNILGIAGLNASLKWILDEGLDNLRAIEDQNRERLLKIISDYSFISTVGIYPECEYVGIVSCIINGISSESAGELFASQGISIRSGLQCAPLTHQLLGTYPSGTVRFSVNCFTSASDFIDLRNALDFIDENI